MRQVLLNAIDAIFPLDKLEQLDINKTFYLCNVNGNTKVNFQHKWSRSMSFEDLVENCFGDYGIFTYPRLDYCFNKAYLETEDSKIWGNGGNYADEKDRSNLTAMIIINLYNVFGAYYGKAVLDMEFITKLCEFSLRPDFKHSKIIKPLSNFIDEYVMPDMQKYIDNHPRKDQVKEKIVENDANYFTALSNYSELIPHVGALLILFAVLYTFVDWFIVNASLGRIQ